VCRAGKNRQLQPCRNPSWHNKKGRKKKKTCRSTAKTSTLVCGKAPSVLQTQLLVAANLGDVENVKKALKDGADVNGGDHVLGCVRDTVGGDSTRRNSAQIASNARTAAPSACATPRACPNFPLPCV